MKQKYLAMLLACLLLCGCSRNGPAEQVQTTEVMETAPAAIPADGDPGDVTCKGSYTADVDAQNVVATAGDAQLTNGQLQIWYWAAAAAYTQADYEIGPDFGKPLDTQPCQIDESVNSWQQYFLRQALDAWHRTQALNQQRKTVPMPTEEAYQPADYNHEKYMTGMPATEFLYGYQEYYEPNTMHQAYLDSLPETLNTLAGEKGYADAAAMAQAAFGVTEDDLVSFAEEYNLAYMYFTQMSYGIEPTEEELTAWCEENQGAYAGEGTVVDFRHILLVPQAIAAEAAPAEDQEPLILDPVKIGEDGKVACSEDRWAACEEEARLLLKQWGDKNRGTEATFADLANKNSQDTGTALDGGAYHRITRGQLPQVLEEWCFAEARQAGDTGIVRSDYGVHILYFSGKSDVSRTLAEDGYYRTRQEKLITDACENYPIEVTYGAITLGSGESTVSLSDLLYADVAHERYPEIPLYLQQDYHHTMYGGHLLSTNGCGITSLAMIASYFTDVEYTPPELCEIYGGYSHKNGTDGMIFNKESAVLGFYMKEKTYDPVPVLEALEAGHAVVCIQHPGYWTKGGHYIVLEKVKENGMIQVRDSNIFNYGRIGSHAQDEHTWGSITTAGKGYWIFDHKITNIPACTRCGEEGSTHMLAEAYTCHKCCKALLRRDTYLGA